MCQSHGILQLPCSVLRIAVLPMHLFLSNCMIWSFSKSLLACINMHDMILFWVLENPSPHLGTFPMPLGTNNTYAQASSNQSIPMLVFTRFSKIINESHAHVYRRRINQNKLSSEPNTYLHKYLLLVPQVSKLALYNNHIHNPTPPHTWVCVKGWPNLCKPQITCKYILIEIWQLYFKAKNSL